jgi:hypothetical protein
MREDLGRVMGDGCDCETLGLELLDGAFQLHELGFAVRSPIGGPGEYQHRTLGSFESVEIPHLAVLIDRPELGNLCPNLDAYQCIVIGRIERVEVFLRVYHWSHQENGQQS